ncbi:MAG: RNA polymerase sigma-70 factor [Prevotella sp.]|nr:RNA polymerase sigma-70 factor [Prevotella sp.]
MMEQDDFSIEAIGRWDEHAFYLLYDRYYKALTYYASKITGVMDISEDLVQELFSQIYESRLHFDSVAHLNAYLYNSVRNSAMDYVRHKNVEQSYILRETEQSHVYPLNEDGEEGLFREEFYHELFMFIDRMPHRQREVFLMYMDGKKNKEIADALHISLETVKTQKKRAMAMLRQKMSPKSYVMLLCFFSA